MFTLTSATSPLFLVFLAAGLLYIVFAWFGLVRGHLPNMRTSLRGARVAGALSIVALGLLGISFYYFYHFWETNGTIFALASGLTFFFSIIAAERVSPPGY